MSIKEAINENLKAAMKANDDNRKRVFRLILAAVKLAEVEKGGPLDDNALLSIIQKEIKIRREAIEGAVTANREDLIAASKNEINVLEEFLPKQISDEEITAMVIEIADQLGANSPSATGAIMKQLMPKVQGRAAGDKVSQIVRQVLQSRS